MLTYSHTEWLRHKYCSFISLNEYIADKSSLKPYHKTFAKQLRPHLTSETMDPSIFSYNPC